MLSGMKSIGQSINTSDTVYYSDTWQKIRKKYATYYRPPVVKDGLRYNVKYYRSDSTLLEEGFVLPIKVNLKYSIEREGAIKHGSYKYYTKKGNLLTVGNYDSGTRVDEWKWYYPNTQKLRREASYYRSQPVIYITGYNEGSSSKQYEGQKWKVQRRDNVYYVKHNVWTYYYEDSNLIKTVANYNLGPLEGKYIRYDSATQNVVFKGNYHLGERVGEWTYYNPRSKKIILTEHYKNGWLHGASNAYDITTGKVLASTTYINGYRVGVWKYFFNGTDSVAVSIDYDSEVRNPEKKYGVPPQRQRIYNVRKNSFKNRYTYEKNIGKITAYDSLYRTVVLNGMLDGKKRIGEWVRYYPETQTIRSKEYYKDNMLDGVMVVYDTSNNKLLEMPFEKGFVNGEVVYFYPGTSNKWIEIEFKEGERTGDLYVYYETGETKRSMRTTGTGEIKNSCYTQLGEKIECGVFYEEASFKENVMTYIGNNLNYPPEAKENRLEGTVKVGFVIKETGHVKDAYVVSGFDERCDEEALRLIEQMPPWKPLIVDGRPIETYKVLPITFWLPEEDEY